VYLPVFLDEKRCFTEKFQEFTVCVFVVIVSGKTAAILTDVKWCVASGDEAGKNVAK